MECRGNFQLTINGACQIIGCASYSDNSCIKCSDPFELSNGICLIKFCTQYSTSGCTQCQQNYFVSNLRCIVQDIYCAKYNN